MGNVKLMHECLDHPGCIESETGYRCDVAIAREDMDICKYKPVIIVEAEWLRESMENNSTCLIMDLVLKPYLDSLKGK